MQNMAILSKLQASGLTATASGKSDTKLETDILVKFGFKVLNLFPRFKQLEAIDCTGKEGYHYL